MAKHMIELLPWPGLATFFHLERRQGSALILWKSAINTLFLSASRVIQSEQISQSDKRNVS
jgi:hypothetical protein